MYYYIFTSKRKIYCFATFIKTTVCYLGVVRFSTYLLETKEIFSTFLDVWELRNVSVSRYSVFLSFFLSLSLSLSLSLLCIIRQITEN